jgi:SAM-dependent methyltransferase
MGGPESNAGRNSIQARTGREFHQERYGGEFVFDELRWSRIRPCLSMVEAERRQKGRTLRIVDVGCGDGAVSRLFLEAGQVFGVDVVPEFVEKAVAQGIEARVADVSGDGLPFPADQMNVVYAGALIEHLYDPEFFLSECYRVLAPDGIVVLSTPNIASLTSRVRMLLGRGPKFYAPALSWEFGGHIRIFTAATLSELLHQCGFAVEELTSNLVSFIPARVTIRPWSVLLGRAFPGLGEVLIAKARKRALRTARTGTRQPETDGR